MKRISTLLIFTLLIMLTACTTTINTSEPPTTPSLIPTTSPSLIPTTSPPHPDPTTLERLQDALLTTCRTELNALGGYYILSSDKDPSFPRWVAETYGLATSGLTGGFVIDDQDNTLFELIVLQVAGQEAGDQSWEALSTYKNRLQEPFYQLNEDGFRVVSEEGSEFYSYLNGAHKIRIGEYLALLICENASEAKDALSDAIHASMQQGNDRPQPVKIADGLFFVDVSRSEIEGLSDPDHPGRTLYIPLNEEDMSLYNTSAIVTAWQSENPSGLSQEDLAIYNSAKEVLETIHLDSMSDFDKEAAIYEWVLQNVDYDWTHTDVMAETPRTSYTPYGGLVERKAICLGYATTFQLLCDLSGLECITVTGASKGSDHAWNQVYLNGEWYCVDPTWDWPYRDEAAEGCREWRYFNTTSDYMARTNHQWDYDQIPEATAHDHGFLQNRH